MRHIGDGQAFGIGLPGVRGQRLAVNRERNERQMFAAQHQRHLARTVARDLHRGVHTGFFRFQRKVQRDFGNFVIGRAIIL